MATINFRIVYRLKKDTPHPSAIAPHAPPFTQRLATKRLFSVSADSRVLDIPRTGR